jgi:hypothetical protein
LQYTDKVIFITATEDDNGKPAIEYHWAKTTGSNNNSMNGMAKAESTDRVTMLLNFFCSYWPGANLIKLFTGVIRAEHLTVSHCIGTLQNNMR